MSGDARGVWVGRAPPALTGEENPSPSYLVVHGVEVDGDAKSHADLVGPGVAPPDGAGGIVNFVRDAVPGQGFRCPKTGSTFKIKE